jgi:hypothetical protein
MLVLQHLHSSLSQHRTVCVSCILHATCARIATLLTQGPWLEHSTAAAAAAAAAGSSTASMSSSTPGVNNNADTGSSLSPVSDTAGAAHILARLAMPAPAPPAVAAPPAMPVVPAVVPVQAVVAQSDVDGAEALIAMLYQ